MKPPLLPSQPRPSHRKFWIILGIALVFLTLPVIAVSNYLRMGDDAEALCSSLRTASGADWDTTLQIKVGSLTVGLVKLGLSFVDLPPEARPMIEAVHAVEVGVYKRKAKSNSQNHAAMLSAADIAMTERGWERLVGVVERHATVAVYLPAGTLSERDTKVWVLVMEKNQMVVVSARADLEPLMALAADHMPRRNRSF